MLRNPPSRGRWASMRGTNTQNILPRRRRIKIAQHNCRGSNSVFISLFHIMKRVDISFVCVQDPPLYNGQPLRALGYECISSTTYQSASVHLCFFESFT